MIKGSDSVSSVDSGSFFRLLLPAIPPLVVMTAALPVLVPRLGPVLATRFPAPSPRVPTRRMLIGAAVLFGLVPLVAAAALRPVRGPGHVDHRNKIGVPVDTSIGLHAKVENGTVHLRWNPKNLGSTRVFYRVLRVRGTLDAICPGQGGADKCIYAGSRGFRKIRTRRTEAIDRPGTGISSYRVAVAADWLGDGDPLGGDVFLVSPRTVVRVP